MAGVSDKKAQPPRYYLVPLIMTKKDNPAYTGHVAQRLVATGDKTETRASLVRSAETIAEGYHSSCTASGSLVLDFGTTDPEVNAPDCPTVFKLALFGFKGRRVEYTGFTIDSKRYDVAVTGKHPLAHGTQAFWKQVSEREELTGVNWIALSITVAS